MTLGRHKSLDLKTEKEHEKLYLQPINLYDTGQLWSAIQVQEIFWHIFCLVAKSKLPILGYIHPY